MKFVSVRELRNRSAQIWRRLGREGDMVITSCGKPIAVLSSVSEDTLEERLTSARRARMASALEAIQERSVRTGKDKTTPAEINEEIARARKDRRR